ncbi:MAG: hypothetical protein M0Z96_04985, partial [Actinomycetota bacterium]|nr:hypothetical protein [Actinomycetota bacterium]
MPSAPGLADLTFRVAFVEAVSRHHQLSKFWGLRAYHLKYPLFVWVVGLKSVQHQYRSAALCGVTF